MNLLVTSSPHIHSGRTTSRLMADVLIALIPAVIAGIIFFGLRAAILMVVSIASCKIAEFLWCVVRRKPHTLRDCSAAVTGLLLALTLPVSVPYWVPVVGGFFAMIVVKGLGGGLGQNTFNPALAARAFLVLLFPAAMTRFAPVGTAIGSASMSVDMVASATPLHHMVMPELPDVSLLDAFLGKLPGCIGEVSALALLIGGAYLVYRKVISLRIPVAYLATVAVLTLIFNKGQEPLLWMGYNLLCGGVMLGAIFMATDYATSPVTNLGQIVYGIGCGVLTVIFRYFGLFPEGVTYAILLMNAVAWALDRITPPRRFTSVTGGAK